MIHTFPPSGFSARGVMSSWASAVGWRSARIERTSRGSPATALPVRD